jgi:DNA-binding GntR family transcriptional regulator
LRLSRLVYKITCNVLWYSYIAYVRFTSEAHGKKEYPVQGIKTAAAKTKKDPIRLAEDLRCRLETEIFSGVLLPGERLDETGLAKRFGVSRTPVREALLQLASSGLIEMRPRQGAVVATITVQSLVQMFEVMAELEAMCARLAARRTTPAERAAIEAAHKACKKAAAGRDPGPYYEANRAFHETLYAGARNGYLEEKTRHLRNRLNGYRRFQLHQPGRIAQSLAEHDAVVEAIVAGNAEAAENAMRAHVTIQGDVFSDLISLLPPRYLQVSG